MNQFLFGSAKNKTQVIARIGIMLALTLALQYVSGLVGIQLLTGSVVNMMLILTAMTVGLVGGVCVGLVTPYVGFLLGLSTNVVLTPFIGISNAIYIALFAILLKVLKGEYGDMKSIWQQAVGLIVGAFAKFLFLFYITYNLLLPLVMATVPAALAVTFGITQFFTAMIGGVCAIAIGFALKSRKII